MSNGDVDLSGIENQLNIIQNEINDLEYNLGWEIGLNYSEIGNIYSDIADLVQDEVSDISSDIWQTFNGVASTVHSYITNASNSIENTFLTFYNTLQGWIVDLMEGIGDYIHDGYNYIKDYINEVGEDLSAGLQVLNAVVNHGVDVLVGEIEDNLDLAKDWYMDRLQDFGASVFNAAFGNIVGFIKSDLNIE